MKSLPFLSFLLFSSLYLFAIIVAPANVFEGWWPLNFIGHAGFSSALPGLALCFFAVLEARFRLLARALAWAGQSPFRFRITIVALSVLMIAGLHSYSVAHNLFGDGNLVAALTAPNSVLPFGFGDQNMKALIARIAPLFDWDTDTTFRVFGAMGGILYATATVVLLSGTTDRKNGILLCLILYTQPFMIFFSNYIETYPFMTGLFALFLSLNITLKNTFWKSGLLTLTLLSLVMLHPLFMIFIPPHLCRWTLLRYPKGPVLKGYVLLTVIGVLAYVVVAALPGKSPMSGALLPFHSVASQAYTVFDRRHLLDFVKSILFIAFPSCFVLLPRGNSGLSAGSKVHIPYAITALAFLFLADFKLGAFDWDVMSLIGLPILFCAVVLTMEMKQSSLAFFAALCFTVGLSAARTGPWLTMNAEKRAAAEYVMEAARFDPHQQLNTRKYSLSKRLKELGLNDLSFELSEEVFSSDSANPTARTNYAQNLLKNGQYHEALSILRQTVARYPDHFHANNALGELYLTHYSEPDSAYKYLSRALRIRPNASDVLYALAFIDLRNSRFEEGRAKLLLCVKDNPLHSNAHASLGLVDVQLGIVEEGVKHLDRAVELGGIPPPTMAVICRTYEQLSMKEKAIQCLRGMPRTSP